MRQIAENWIETHETSEAVSWALSELLRFKAILGEAVGTRNDAATEWRSAALHYLGPLNGPALLAAAVSAASGRRTRQLYFTAPRASQADAGPDATIHRT